DQNSEGATPFLARAAHFAPKNARYRAYYGKALSSDDKQRHKAEAEMQAAVKIDPDNPTYRLILAEFFIQVNLMKRAEGELNRLLAIYPSNREARALLDSIRAKT
ncbi:MAG: tetratricopeptide repeat protein, partial [Pyrinomonadaceae bacterium]|nr:tetratricopeptide repeat protein [Pyrinomonadaceae bacterium]